MDEFVEVESHEEWAAKRVQQQLTDAIQLYLDRTAQERGYDNILSLCTYATSTNPTFAAEGQAAVEWRDNVWAHAYQVMDAVLAGQRAIHSADELIAELPTFQWPEV